MKKIMLIGSALVLFAAPALAGTDDDKPRGEHRDHAKHMEKMIEKMDANGDGIISRDEFNAAPMDRLGKADADGDGDITLAEFKAGAAARGRKHEAEDRDERAEKMFGHMDTDGDGVITGAERAAKRAEHFAMADQDGNGELSRDELAAGRKMMRGMRGRHRDHEEKEPASDPY